MPAACSKVRAEEHVGIGGAVGQVEELPNKNHPHTYKVRNWVTRDHSFTMFLVRAELEYIEPVP